MTGNEVLIASQHGRDYWLYVVDGVTTVLASSRHLSGPRPDLRRPVERKCHRARPGSASKLRAR